jgi:hypothetical protein
VWPAPCVQSIMFPLRTSRQPLGCYNGGLADSQFQQERALHVFYEPLFHRHVDADLLKSDAWDISSCGCCHEFSFLAKHLS